MGIFINNQNRRREYQTIQDLQSQIQAKLSDPGVSADAKQAAQDALNTLSSNISQQNMRKDVARQYTIDQMNTILTSLNSTSSLYKPTYVQAGPLRRIEIFDPTVLEDPLEIQGVDPVKKERVQAFAQNLATELKKYQTMLDDNSIALEGWKVDNTAKIGQWLQDIALKDNMTEIELDTKIAQMGRIVEALEHAGLIGSHSAYFSSFVPQEEEEEVKEEGPAADDKQYLRFGLNDYEITPYPGPVGDILAQKGKVAKLGNDYYLFNSQTGRPEPITGGDNFMLDPTHPAYKYAWYADPVTGKLTVGQVDNINFRNLIGEDAFQQLRTNIINEHKRKFPIEYYAAQGGQDIWDFSNYMRDEGAGAGIHIYDSPFKWEGPEFLMPWDQIFSRIPDWQQYFNYAGNTDRDEYGNPINNQYANKHHYIQNAELPKQEDLASDEEFESFLNLELGNNYTIRKILPFNLSDPEQALTQAFTALLKTGDNAHGNIQKVSLKIRDLSIPLADRRALKNKYGETISGEKLLYNYLFIKYPKVAKRLLMNIIQRKKMSSYEPAVDPQNAYGYMQDVLKAKQGGILKLQRGRIVTYVQPDDLGLTGGEDISTPTPISAFFDSDYNVRKETTVNGSDTTEYMWSVDDLNKRWQNRVTSSLPLIGAAADPDTERGKVLSLDDIFKDPDTRNPLILRALSIGSDLAGAFAAVGTGPGTAVALGTGLASTGLEYWADWIDPTVSKEERRRNLGVNTGLTAVGAVPGMKFIQTAGKGVDFIRTLCKLVGGASALIGGLGMGAQASDRIQELIANPDSREFTQEDLMLIMQIISAFIQRGTASKQKSKLNDAVAKTTVEGRRDVPFVGTDGQTVYVSMTEAQYKNYLNAGRNASTDKGKAALNEVKSYLSDADAAKLQSNDPQFGNFSQVIDRWRTPLFDGSSWWNPLHYKDVLTGNILRGTVRPEVANTPELPGPVKWAGVRQDASPSLNAPTVTKTPDASGKAESIEVYNGRVGQRDKQGRLTFKGLDFETAYAQKYARETTIPKEIREKGEKLNGEDFKQAMRHLGVGVPDGVTPTGGYVYNNKLYWWKQGGKLNRLSQYLNNK